MADNRFKDWFQSTTESDRDQFWNRIFDQPFMEDVHKENVSSPQIVNEHPNYPQVDMFEYESQLTLLFDLPGVKRGDVELQAAGNELIIRGKKLTRLAKEANVLLKERRDNTFERVIPLPKVIDEADCRATFQNGVLIVTFQFTTLSNS
ncbi:Hsp20/alpha crystallin family protein [Priestia koreensis]|uniref:Hsp20/alpha crystallin family protein n=1 Tax=Priestia koreensis TaxID=284581 RepID=UPI002041F65B|nr:Hsp20 family protein [Priestia koreensis]MCM3006193.1 Hsp20 family protein [Priestia koreensis]